MEISPLPSDEMLRTLTAILNLRGTEIESFQAVPSVVTEGQAEVALKSELARADGTLLAANIWA